MYLHKTKTRWMTAVILAVLLLSFYLGGMNITEVMASSDAAEGSAVSEALESVDMDAPMAENVEIDAADAEAEKMMAELEQNGGTVFFAESGGTGETEDEVATQRERDAAAETAEVSLNYTKIIRHEGWFTRSFTVQHDGKTKVAYCIEPKDYPPDKSTHTAVRYDNEIMAKALYYSYGYPGFETTMQPYLAASNLDSDYSGSDGAYVISHLILSYFYDNESDSSDAFKGLSTETKAVIKKMAKAIRNEWPDIPEDSSLEIDKTKVYAGWDPDRQYKESPVMTLKGHKDNKITVRVPAGITMIKLSDNELTEFISVDDEWQTVELRGGDEFFFTAPESAEGVYDSGEMTGSLQDFQPYLIKVADKQDIMYCGDGAADAVSFSVEWEKTGKFRLDKISGSPEITDNNAAYSLEGAIYEIYDEKGQLYEEVDTDVNGDAEVILPYGEYTIRETAAPKGYSVDEQSHYVSVAENETVFEHVEKIIPQKKLPDDSPQTGDENWPMMAVGAALLSMMIVIACICRRAL